MFFEDLFFLTALLSIIDSLTVKTKLSEIKLHYLLEAVYRSLSAGACSEGWPGVVYLSLL